MSYEVTEVDVSIEFKGEGKTSYPCALGTCMYRGDMYYFYIVEQNCLTGFMVHPEDAVFLCWLEDGEGPSLNKIPVWAGDDDTYYYEIEDALDHNKEVLKVKAEMRRLSFINWDDS